MVSDEEKRAQAATRARRYRERKRANANAADTLPGLTRDAVASSTIPPADAPKPPAFTMLNSVNAAIDAMKWLQPSDFAAVDLARMTALQYDNLLAGDPSATGRAASLGQLLTRVLHELGGTPTVRLAHELRSMRLQPPTADPKPGDPNADDLDEEASEPSRRKSGATVTSIKRPPKRKRA